MSLTAFSLPPFPVVYWICPRKGRRNHGPGGEFFGFLATNRNQKVAAANAAYRSSILLKFFDRLVYVFVCSRWLLEFVHNV